MVHYASTWTCVVLFCSRWLSWRDLTSARSHSTVIILFFGVLQGYIWQTAKYTSGDYVSNSDLWCASRREILPETPG